MAGIGQRNWPLDLGSCAREPIHIIGHIQSHGLLFALSEPDFIVRQVSANVGTLLGTSTDAILGTSLESVLGRQQFQEFRSRLASDDLISANPLRVVVGNSALEMDCVAHRYDGVLIAECERVNERRSAKPSELATNIGILLTRMGQASGIIEYSEIAASEIQRLSGFNRVMVYRFDADWNGEVIAEAGQVPEPATPAYTSYLGLNFPATDIPAQARQLFLTNQVRSIADIDSTPVPLVPEIGPLTGRPLDMSQTFLRGVSPIHIEYLRNIGVRSSLSVSIIVDDRLWGLVACHHHAPRPVDCATRSICGLIAQNLALQVTSKNANAARKSRRIAAEMIDEYEHYAERVQTARGLFIDSASAARFIDMLDADGVVSHLSGTTSSQGLLVAQESLRAIVGHLQSLMNHGVASSDRLALDDPVGAQISGGLYIELSKRSGEYLLFVRREHVRTVNWAGNPDKSASADVAGKLHPRTSFAQWQEAVRGRSRPWTELQLESARFLRAELLHIGDAQRLQA